MARLTDEQLSFLRSMDVPLSKVFDASGMPTHAYMQQMSDLGLWIAYGVTPCTNAGHTLRTRKGHCVQCRTAQLTYLRRHEVKGTIYVAHSVRQGLVKVGMTEREPADRLLALNSYSYGGCNDWKIVFQVRCNNAGKVESSTHQFLLPYVFNAIYVSSGREVMCRELFRCDQNVAIAAVRHCLGALEKSASSKVDSEVEMPPFSVPKHPQAMTSDQKESQGDLQKKRLTQDALQQTISKILKEARKTPECSAGHPIQERIAAQASQPRRKSGYLCPFCRSEIPIKPPTVCPKCATGIPADSGKPSLIWPEHSNQAPDTRDGAEGRHIADSK